MQQIMSRLDSLEKKIDGNQQCFEKLSKKIEKRKVFANYVGANMVLLFSKFPYHQNFSLRLSLLQSGSLKLVCHHSKNSPVW